MDGIREKYGLSERRACRIVGQHRGTRRYVPTLPADEDALTQAIIALASEYGRSGYRRVTALLQADGWREGEDRVQRIWRREGLKIPQRHRPRSRLWLNDGSCVRLRPLYRNHVWSFDFVQAQTHDGRSLRILTLIDEHSWTCLALKVARRINGMGLIEALADAMCLHGIPKHIRCDNGPEVISKALRKSAAKTGPQIHRAFHTDGQTNYDSRRQKSRVHRTYCVVRFCLLCLVAALSRRKHGFDSRRARQQNQARSLCWPRVCPRLSLWAPRCSVT